MTLPRSYSTDYADHRRASRVGVSPAIYSTLELLGPVDLPLAAAPESVLVHPDGHRWALGYRDRTLVLDANGITTHHTESGGWIAAFDPDGLRLGNRVWTGPAHGYEELRPFGVFDEPGTQLVARRRDDLWIVALVSRPAFKPIMLKVRVRASGAPGNDDVPRWAYTTAGEGTAAIADDDTIAIATLNGCVRCLRLPASVDAETLDVVGEAQLEHEPYQLSAVHRGFIVVGAIEAATPAAGPARRGRVHGRGARRFAADWATEVRSIDMHAHTEWTARVDFPVLQPAIELDEARIVVAGRGLACIEAGRVLWSMTANVDVYATAFVDGTLAAGIGSRLVILDRDGNTVNAIDLPRGMSVVTPPAIAADRTLVFGSTGPTFMVPVADV